MRALLARLNPIDAIRARLAARRDDAVPVRDWVRAGTGQPPRLLGFDQVLVWVALALLTVDGIRQARRTPRPGLD